MYGKSRAGILLEKEINELIRQDKTSGIRIRKKIAHIFDDFSVGLKELSKINFFKHSMLVLWRNEILNRINKASLPDMVREYFEVVIVGLTRNKIRQFLIDNPKVGPNVKKKVIEAHNKRQKEFECYPKD